ncbi:peroxiredoxin [Rhodobacteraceae bacterium XHP0102]|nr:peroxiredoxin [Rhodobacteraceae bacterium XHP0102]
MSASSNHGLEIDWETIPAPVDDGAADHLRGERLPDMALRASDGHSVRLAALRGLTVIFAYPRTGRPDVALPDGWNDIPGARGCTPQSCAFRDLYAELRALGVDHLFGLSTQDSAYQAEAVARLHLPYAMLSDQELALRDALRLPSFEVAGEVLLKRLTLIIRDGIIEDVIYPVFPPDENASQVVKRLTKA